MQTINISLSDALKQVVERQVAQGHYGSASEYVSELIRADERRKVDVETEATAWLQSFGHVDS